MERFETSYSRWQLSRGHTAVYCPYQSISGWTLSQRTVMESVPYSGFGVNSVTSLTKPVTVELQHCAISENASWLNFNRAKCTQKQLPFIFRQLNGGDFTNNCSCEHKSFSTVAVTQSVSADSLWYYSQIFCCRDQNGLPSTHHSC